MKKDTSEYILIEANTVARLTAQVTEQMRNGFRPYGEAHPPVGGSSLCYQAMTKISSEVTQELKDGVWQ
jgi:Domain of unknown function (DUF1737)